MKRSLGAKRFLYPMPALMVGSYDENGNPDVCNVGWGGICSSEPPMVQVCLRPIRKTLANIGKAGMHAVPSEHVNAPVIEEFKLTLECRVVEMREVGSHVQIDGEIVNVLADEDILDENGGVDIAKLDPILVDPSADTYHRVGECVGKIFHDGLKLK